jgi:heme exporter protein A
MQDVVPAIEASELGRSYGERRALSGVNLRLRPGRSLLVCGPNGAGKTTLIRLLGTLQRPTAGSLRIFGSDPQEALLAVRRRLALLSHRNQLYSELSASEMLASTARMTGRPADRARDDALLERVGLAGRGRDLVREFSAGMKKRLGFARLLLQDPDLVLLDEPYGQLDNRGRDWVDGLLDELSARGKTLVVSTHMTSRVASRLHAALILADGRVLWVGPAKDAADEMPRILQD